jgi:serine/threonine protein kinase
LKQSIIRLRIIREAGATRLALVKDTATDRYYVEKTLVVDIDFQKKLFENEIRVHSSLRHRHIIKFERRTSDQSFLMEYAAKGNFLSLLNVQPRPPRLFAALVDFLKGLAYLHAEGLVHNDIKPSNMLLTEDRTKLADFAFAGRAGQVTFPEIPSYSMVGTGSYAPRYRSPEQGNSVRDDLHACGVILYQVFSDVARPEEIDLERIGQPQARDVIQQCLQGEFHDVEALWVQLQNVPCTDGRGNLTALRELNDMQPRG